MSTYQPDITECGNGKKRSTVNSWELTWSGTCTTLHALTDGCLCTLMPTLTRSLLFSEDTSLSLTDMKGKFVFCYKTPRPFVIWW